ncbi:MAG: T9SS type A sorting domain-containing protein, partial [Bacteroidales bacterium]|nr:T9SS type A sorting domain-containing protein [Bacteroidales bacterium]
GETASTDTDTFRHSSNHTFSVSPNPSSGHYTLRVDQPDDDIINIRVVDANGRVVEQHTTSEPLSQYTYNGHLAADGIYYVTVSSNGYQKTIKLIVVK